MGIEMKEHRRNLKHWPAMWVSAIFGLVTFYYAENTQDRVAGTVCSFFLCVICAIKILNQDDEEVDENEHR
jgi:hypothetical protein